MRKKLFTALGSILLGIGCIASSVYVEGNNVMAARPVQNETVSNEASQDNIAEQTEALSEMEDGTMVLYPEEEITCTGQRIKWDKKRIQQKLQEQEEKAENCYTEEETNK